MKKKSLKKKMVIALAGIILAGSMGWNQIPAQAAVNGEIICTHNNKKIEETNLGTLPRGMQGHALNCKYVKVTCTNTACKIVVNEGIEYGPLEAHTFSEHHMFEDLHNGLYYHWIKCPTCGYEDEVLSDSPTDPRV